MTDIYKYSRKSEIRIISSMRNSEYSIKEENLKIVSEIWRPGPGHLIKKGHLADAPLHFKPILGIGP